MTKYSLTTLFILVAAIAVAIAIGLELNKSEITSYLQVSAFPEEVWFVDKASARSSEQEYQRLVNSVIETLRSKPLLTRALRSPSLSASAIARRPDAVDWLSTNLKVTVPGQGELICISLDYADPDEGVAIVTAVVDTYFKEIVEREILERARAEEKLTQLYETMKTKLLREAKDLNQLAKTLVIIGDVGNEGLVRYPEYAIREQELKRQQRELDELGSRLHALWLEKQMPPRVRKIAEAAVTQ